MWEFRNNNTFGATAFTSFGAFWLSFAFEQFFADGVPETDVGDAVGLYLIAWGIFTAYMWIASFRVSVAVNVVFLLLMVTFFVLGIGDAAGNETIRRSAATSASPPRSQRGTPRSRASRTRRSARVVLPR